MSIFLILMIAGLFGMALLSIPALGHHGGGAGLHGHVGHALPSATHAAIGHAPAAGHALPSGANPAAHNAAGRPAATNNAGGARFVPTPRIVFSIIAAFGAFGYMGVEVFHLAPVLAAILALVPAILVERLALTPLWNLLLGFRGEPCTPVTHLIMAEAEAVTPFRNGKGIVRVVHDGRDVQFSAQLTGDHANMPVQVGDKLRVEEVEPDGERVKVSVG